MNNRYKAEQLVHFASNAFQQCGLTDERAEIVARTLVEADLMGHTTHGLQLLYAYLRELQSGGMASDGQPEVISDMGASITWHGQFLPGPWLVHEAIDIGLERIKEHPIVSVAIQRSHHIASLASYPERATQQDLIMIVYSSDPNNETVVPHGGIRGVYSPNPIAYGIPTEGDPILLDTSMSTLANGMVLRKKAAGEKFDHAWMLDGVGSPTADPTGFSADPPSVILPNGGLELGYKGFGLAILVEALTSALSGRGRTLPPGRWCSSVFIQIIDPSRFGGIDHFKREMQNLANRCHETPVRSGDPPVRMPGERALANRRDQLRKGVNLHPSVITSLEKSAALSGIALPDTMR
ncbi:MAG: Ldh family oxidoreductase [Saprospiraceae bacterium]|nr:Ldh family oxidoreductase [Saprospiraceae bacterium]